MFTTNKSIVLNNFIYSNTYIDKYLTNFILVVDVDANKGISLQIQRII